MSEYCDRLQRFLVEHGAAVLKDDAEAQQHLVDCSNCFDFLEALQQVDATLAHMPEHDAPDKLVQKTLGVVRNTLGAPEAAPAALVAATETAEETRPWCTRRLIAWLGRMPHWVWGVLTFAWLWRRLRTRSEPTPVSDKPRWKRLLTSPKFLIPATAVPSLLLLTTVLVLSPGTRRKHGAKGVVPAEPVRAGEITYDDSDDARRGNTDRFSLKQTREQAANRTGSLEGTEGEASGMGYTSPGRGGSGRTGGSKNIGGLAAGDNLSDVLGTIGSRSRADGLDEVLPRAAAAQPTTPLASEPDATIHFMQKASGPVETKPPGDLIASEEIVASNELHDERLRRLEEAREKQKRWAGLFHAQLDAGKKDEPAKVDENVASDLSKAGEVDNALVNLSGVTTQARIVPSFEDGRLVGFKLYSIKPGSIYAKVGLENGDVIQRINGHQVSTPDKALELYHYLEGARSVSIDFLRRGERSTVTFLLEEAATSDTPAARFLAERARNEGIEFKSPDGYWANTYVPGDPAMRLLASRLERTDRTVLGNLRLDRAAHQYAQPFDAPTNAAIDVYVHADQASLKGEKRMLVQVGIQGTPRRSRSRTPMNVAVVLDLSGSPATEQQNAMRALVMALGEARDIGDRFTLVIAGRPGGVKVRADSFKHGPLVVAMRSLLGGDARGETLTLPQAVERAIGIVVGEDDPTKPLGSSVVLVITPNRIAPHELGTLTDMAHESAVNGVPISVVGVGPDISMEQLDQLTLAGQGNRRPLASAADAAGVVERELSSVNRVIARAVRLRIRLAPGVKLVDVIGSHRLGEERAEQVRQAEQSIDRRMARNLGLVSDRGEDEDGVQMVIPSYYAGDTHVILLDVVAPGPGPIADVSVRYKDLVYLKNGVARANLALPRGPLRAGPLEHNVLKNYLARKVSAVLERAGDRLDGGDIEGAQDLLVEQVELLVSLMQEIPALASDRDLYADLAMLNEYTSVLTAAASGQPRDYVIDSLRYAAFLKVLPRPAEN
jgi:hypothetical protein